MELIKPIIRVGNSAGVILPREWLNGKARIELVEKPLDIGKEIFVILGDYLQDIIGIYLSGSYARNEQTKKSDIDVMVITNETSAKIEKGKYNIILIKKNDVEKALKDNVMPILPMLRESKALLNKELIEKYKETLLTEKNLKWHMEIVKSALKLNKEAIEFDWEEENNCSDATSYSLILHLRSVYIVDCMIKNKLWSNKEFIRLIRDVSGSLTAYQGYFRVKNNERTKRELLIDEAGKIYNYIKIRISEQEKWVKREK